MIEGETTNKGRSFMNTIFFDTSFTENYNVMLLSIVLRQGKSILIPMEAAFCFITSSYFGICFGHLGQMSTILLSQLLTCVPN